MYQDKIQATAAESLTQTGRKPQRKETEIETKTSKSRKCGQVSGSGEAPEVAEVGRKVVVRKCGQISSQERNKDCSNNAEQMQNKGF